MDENDALILITEYETMSAIERFWFMGSDIRMRTSAVKRFGGFNTSTFCTEIRVNPDAETVLESTPEDSQFYSAFGW
jgi:hypothetical protein